MLLQEIMESRVFTVSANDYALEALRLLQRKRQPWAFVLDCDGVAGIVLRETLESLPEDYLHEDDVRRHTTEQIIMVGPEVESQEAERLLRLSQQGFLAIIEGKRPIGIITAENLKRSMLPCPA
jgi:CBS domain-containing protein